VTRARRATASLVCFRPAYGFRCHWGCALEVGGIADGGARRGARERERGVVEFVKGGDVGDARDAHAVGAMGEECARARARGEGGGEYAAGGGCGVVGARRAESNVVVVGVVGVVGGVGGVGDVRAHAELARFRVA